MTSFRRLAVSKYINDSGTVESRPTLASGPLLGARAHFGLFFTAFFLLSLSACSLSSRVPVPRDTIPPAPILTPMQEEQGHQTLQQITEEYPLDFNDPGYDRSVAIVEKLTSAIGANKDPWHVYLLKGDDVKNAAATRGNHIFIWTGMVNFLPDDDELAAVLSHEIAHIVARHTDPDPKEQWTSAIINAGSMAIGVAASVATQDLSIGGSVGDITSSLTNQMANGLLLSTYSREMELEADRVGLLIMAEAGYDPQKAVDFWERVKDDPEFGASQLSFFSTHPPGADRIAALKESLPDALRRRQGISRNEVSNPTHTPITRTGARDIWRVFASSARVWSAPDEGSHKVADLQRGQEVEVVSKSRGWLKIVTPNEGYVRGVWLSPQ